MTHRPEQAADAMTETALADAVDRWGGDLHDWPTPVAAAARKLLEHSAIAREELALAQQLDALLADLPGKLVAIHVWSW